MDCLQRDGSSPICVIEAGARRSFITCTAHNVAPRCLPCNRSDPPLRVFFLGRRLLWVLLRRRGNPKACYEKRQGRTVSLPMYCVRRSGTYHVDSREYSIESRFRRNGTLQGARRSSRTGCDIIMWAKQNRLTFVSSHLCRSPMRRSPAMRMIARQPHVWFPPEVQVEEQRSAMRRSWAGMGWAGLRRVARMYTRRQALCIGVHFSRQSHGPSKPTMAHTIFSCFAR